MRRSAARMAILAAALAATALSAQRTEEAARQTPAIPEASCLDPNAPPEPAAAEPAPVLVDGLGYAGLEPDSDHEEARAWFAQGVRLVWAFDEVEAIRAFEQAQRLDPDCAMCFFGEAWARSPTINLQPRTEQLADARAAAQHAVELAGDLSERDRLLVRAMAIRTAEESAEDGAFNQAAYASFVETAALRMPQDDTLAILAADARMQVAEDMQPGSLSQRLIERVLARNPGHGGAIHFYIHLTDWIDRQHLAVPHAERLGAIAPAASHLVHMPSHSFYGVGRYRDAAAVNVAAIAVDRDFVRNVRPAPSAYRTGLLAHNMHFAINSALARGDGATAHAVSQQAEAEFMRGEPDNRARLIALSTHYTAGLHGDIDELLARPEPEDSRIRIAHLYARGEALARRGDAAAVRAEAAALAALLEGDDSPSLGRYGTALAEVFKHVLEGRAAMLDGEHDAAASAYRAAMDRQLAAGFGSDPPIFWYSVRRSLAAALLAGGDAEGARRQLYASLRRWPNDALALYTLSLADRRLGDARSAERNLARARAAWAGDLSAIPLARI